MPNLDGASDYELLRRSRSGEEPFAVFYRRHERLVGVGWLVRQTGRPDLAADLTAEVFAAAYIAAPRFRPGPEPAAAWLLGIARNKLLRSLRNERTEASARRRLAMSTVPIDDDALAAITSIDSSGLLAFLDDLPEGQRDAVRARVVEDLGYEELARHLNVTEQVARKRVSRGLRQLRQHFSQGGAPS
ncbi:MAG TPA: sigma-70 family RNA polymerase sigma factor [Solirubrobacteraceae bacterium]|jgi:RNA polymerase sigma-70 factor (ECF subfamily)|nr:sigma-70 family RNA polymerase sigma factor [Solirubrobacteraceae bacterium]